MTYEKCKILSPVGSTDILKSAVFSGADFVYLSGTKYGARDYAENFSYNELKKAITFCHKYNVKVFVTVNISILENEILDVLDYIYFLYNNGVDGIIVQDIGLAYIVTSLIPDLSIHASTQMTIYDYSFIKWLCENGFESANISREVPVIRIKEISKKLKRYNNDINLEVFVHGALCYCYSGQCLMSSFLGGRSGNRGLCAQPCRMRYSFRDYYNTLLKDENYLLSTKDLCVYTNLDELLDSGVNCLKIEGRMKSSEYVASTTYAYKNAVNKNFSKEDYLLLNLAFNRGFTEGYISNKLPEEIMSRNRAGNQGYPIGRVVNVGNDTVTIKFINKSFPTKIVNGDGLKFEYDGESCGMYVSKIISQNKNKLIIKRKKDIEIEKDSMVYITYSKYLKDKTKSIINESNVHKTEVNLIISINNKSQIEIEASCDYLKNSLLFTSTEKLEEAKNKPLTKETFTQQLTKTGNTNYIFKKITFKTFKNNKFMPISGINNIRRELIETIDKKIMKTYIPSKKDSIECKKRIQDFKTRHYQKNNRKINEKWNIYINNLKQAEAVNEHEYINTVYFDSSFNHKTINEYIENISKELINLQKIIPNKEIVWILPQILLDKELPHISEIIVKLKFNNINIKIQTDNIGIAKNLDVEKYGSNLNVYNNYTISKLSKDPGFKKLQISNEISYEDILLLDNNQCELEYTLFGHLQLMITKDNFEDIIEEEIKNTYYLIDKRNNQYLLKKDCNNNSHIYDYRVLNLEKHVDKLRKTNINNFTIDCRFFNVSDTKLIVKHFDKIRNYQDSELILNSKQVFFEGNLKKGVYKNN